MYLKANHLITYGAPKVLSKIVHECEDVTLIGKHKQEYDYTEHVTEALGMIQQKYPCQSSEKPVIPETPEDSTCGFSKDDFIGIPVPEPLEPPKTEYEDYVKEDCSCTLPSTGSVGYWLY